jgi:hypothetical protein
MLRLIAFSYYQPHEITSDIVWRMDSEQYQDLVISLFPWLAGIDEESDEDTDSVLFTPFN